MSADQLLQIREERDLLMNYIRELGCPSCPCCNHDGCLYPDIDCCLDAVKQWVSDEIKKGLGNV